MNRKPPAAAWSNRDESERPDRRADKPAVPFQRCSPANVNRLAADLELGIRDLPVWKDLVQRVGLTEARNILRQGLTLRLLTDGSPEN